MLRNKLSEKINGFIGINDIEPKLVFDELFSEIIKGFVNNDNGKNNLYQNVFKNLVEPANLPRNFFPKLYEKIEEFNKSYASPFVDNFYFILLLLTKCIKCKNIIDVKFSITYFLGLDGNMINKVSELIKNYTKVPSDKGQCFCNNCNANVNSKKEYSFLNTPNYLFIDFEGRKKPKMLEDEIDLTPYSMTNIGPKKYNLYAYITKDKNEKFEAYIKFQNIWYKYFDEHNVQSEYNQNGVNTCCPYIAIYKGLSNL